MNILFIVIHISCEGVWDISKKEDHPLDCEKSLTASITKRIQQ